MKRLTIPSFTVLFLLSTFVFADSELELIGKNGIQNDSTPDNGNLHGLKIKPEMMQQHRIMYAELVQIQKEPSLKKRYDLMAAHIQNMQRMLNDMQGEKMTPQLLQKRQSMQDEMMMITKEPNLQKRQTLLTQHMHKMLVNSNRSNVTSK